MTSKAEIQRLAFEAAIRANAVSYSIQLFLGRGAFERAQADTLDEAIAIGAAMKAAHPSCQAQPIYYAIEPSGHSTTITPAQFSENHAMIKTTTKPAKPAPTKPSALGRKLDASAKATKLAAEVKGVKAKGEALLIAAQKTEALIAEGDAKAAKAAKPATAAKGDKLAAARVAKAQKHADKIAAEMAPQKAALALLNAKPDATDAPPLVAGSLVLDDGKATEAKPARNGLCMTKALALAEARAAFGADAKPNVDFQFKRCVRGEFYWGENGLVPEAHFPKAFSLAAPVVKGKAAKAASKATKALRATEATKASVVLKAPAGKRGEAAAAALRGVLPAAPDFSAATHTRFRPRLAEVEAMVKAKDVKGLEAFVWKGFVSSSPKAILRYRDLALTALKAKA